MVEPLHELKNVINRVFDELPYAVTDTDLKSAINEMLKALKGTLWSVWNSLSSNCSLSYVFIIIINIYAVISYCPLPNTYMYFKRSVLRNEDSIPQLAGATKLITTLYALFFSGEQWNEGNKM